MVTAPTLLDQLHGKVAELRKKHERLQHGDLLREAFRVANDPTVWVGGPQLAFCGWLEAFDGWMRHQFADALGAVRHRVEAYVSACDNYQHAADNLIPGVALPPPPSPVGSVPPVCPHPFKMQPTRGSVPQMNPDMMRKALVNALGRAKDDVLALSRELDQVLTEPAVSGGAAPPTPVRHLPPDAKEAAGVPHSFTAIANELDEALRDVLTRAETWEQAQAVDDTTEAPSLGFGGLLKAASELVERARDRAEVEPPPAPTTPEADAPAPVDGVGERAPVAQPPPEVSRKAADDLVRDYPPGDKTLDDPKRVEELANKLRDHVPNPDPLFAARFVERYGAKNMIAMGRSLQAWQQGWDKFRDRRDDNQRGLGVGQAYDKPSREQIEGAIYSFSATLATATTSGSLPDKVEEDLLKTNDPLALSWLLSDPNARFDPAFLVRAFDKCVKNTIIIDASHKGQPWQDDFRSNPGLVLTGSILSHDPKIAALEAISRNPDAALRLQREFKPFELRYGGGHGSRKIESLADLLYQGTDVGRGYPDGGNSVGRTLTTIYDSLLAQSQSNAQAGLEAQHLLGQMVKSASSTTLPNGCRQNLAKILSGRMANVAAIIHDPDNQLSAEFKVDEDFSVDEVKSTLSEIAHDPTALATAMGGLGSFVGNTYDELTRRMAAQADPAAVDPSLLRDYKQENLKIGETFCEMARAVRSAGIKDREKAMAALASFRFGVDIVFDAVKKIPVVGAVEEGLDTATAGAAGKVTGSGEDALKDKVAGWLSGVDAEEEQAKSKKLTRNNVTALNGILFDRSIAAMGKQPLLMHALLTRDPAAKWPESMMRQPHPAWPPQTAPTDGSYLNDYLLPQYLTGEGGVQFPVPGDPAYHDYRSWCKQDWNTVAEQAHTMSDAASEKMTNCMAEQGWIDAA